MDKLWTPASEIDGAWALDPGTIQRSRKGTVLRPIAGGSPQAVITRGQQAAPAAPVGQAGAPRGAAPRPLQPFVRSSYEHVEPAFDTSFTPGATAASLGPFDVPAYGFCRAIWLLVTTSGGTAGAGVLAADAPWNVFDEVVFLDINGAPVYGPTSGFELMVANMFGGYAWAPNPFDPPDAVPTGVVTFVTMLRIPVEITAWDAYGSLANQNAAAAYKVRLTGNTSANIWSTAPTTIPAVRVRGFLEAWSQPPAADLFGNPQEQLPPGHGTTQFWSKFIKTITSGQNTIVLPRVGNLIRNLILIARTDAAGTPRSTAMFPDSLEVRWDARQVTNEPIQYRRTAMFERYGIDSADFPAGVLAYDNIHDQDGHGGNENRHLWYPTVQATRLEIAGSFDNAGTLTVLTNDVAPAGGR